MKTVLFMVIDLIGYLFLLSGLVGVLFGILIIRNHQVSQGVTIIILSLVAIALGATLKWLAAKKSGKSFTGSLLEDLISILLPW
jgi:uncharacterized membrane protein